MLRALTQMLLRSLSRSTLALSLFLLPLQAGAETATSSVTSAPAPVDLERLKADLREDVKTELREELLEELRKEIKKPDAAEGTDDGWAEEEWKWEAPVKPELNFFELDGYFRFRYDFFNNLDLGTYYAYKGPSGEPIATGPFATNFSPPVPACNTDVNTRINTGNPNDNNRFPLTACSASGGRGAGESESLGGANLRLRLEPTFNVYEDIKIKMQVDVLDNLVLGSTPDGFPNNPISPLLAFSQGQIAPIAGRNTVWTDSIAVKRVWAEVMTPLGQLRVGRMPSHFGMGILANDGRGIDSDFGDSSDRIMFATKIGDFYLVPAFDWVVSGPTSANILAPYGQPFDRDQRDDVDQYLLAIIKKDSPEVMQQKLDNDEVVFNFGTNQVGRFQSLDAASYFQGGDPNAGAEADSFVERDAQAYIYSYCAELRWRKLTIEAEYSGILGRIGNGNFSTAYARGENDPIDISQHGAALKAEYKLLNDALTIRLLVLAASGDDAPGWGVYPLSDTSGRPGAWDGSQVSATDRTISNFRFDPNYNVDMILWRQLVGTVTDALVVRPGVQYNLTKDLGGRLDIVYSRAWFAESTPSGSKALFTGERSSNNDLYQGEPDNNLGVEADFTLFYASEDGFNAMLQYGMFIPMDGMDRLSVIEAGHVNTNLSSIDGQPAAVFDATIAHTLQVLLGVAF